MCGSHWSKTPPVEEVWGQSPSGRGPLPDERSPKPKKAALGDTQTSSAKRSRSSGNRKSGSKGGKGGKGEGGEAASWHAQTKGEAEDGATKLKLRWPQIWYPKLEQQPLVEKDEDDDQAKLVKGLEAVYEGKSLPVELQAIVDKHKAGKEQRSKPQDMVFKSTRKLGQAEARIKAVKEKEKITNEKWATYLSELQQTHQAQVEAYMQAHGQLEQAWKQAKAEQRQAVAEIKLLMADLETRAHMVDMPANIKDLLE